MGGGITERWLDGRAPGTSFASCGSAVHVHGDPEEQPALWPGWRLETFTTTTHHDPVRTYAYIIKL